MSFSTWRRGTGPVSGAAMTPFRSATASITRTILPMTEASLRRQISSSAIPSSLHERPAMSMRPS
jgi:hypothetical protein